ncbi:MAG TPA: type II secretion system F family protein [Patescibacteria group bacterium]|nr:type II secretion system F family protein [Patescibacteria group bacterium]
MRKYNYKAKNKEGKTVKGAIEATDEKQAALVLRGKSLVLFSLQPTKKDLLKMFSTKFVHRIGSGEVATFTRQLSTMITAGLTVADALRILKEQSSPSLISVIDDVLREVEGGSTLAAALEKHHEVFNDVYVALVKAGEAAGVLDEVLNRLAENLEKQKEFKSKVKGAMIYPMVIVVGMLIVGTIMMIFVIPKLLGMYEEFQADLPLPTKILISFSDLATRFWWIVLIGGGVAVFSLRSFQKTPLGQKKIDQLKLQLPIYGNLQKMTILTEVTRTLGLLVSTGISIIDGLNIVARAANNTIYLEELQFAAKQVEKGLPLGGTLAEFEEFPPVVPHMISVGEETGKLDEVLTKLSHYFESESGEMVKGLTTAIEPLIMVVLGLGVGFLIIAVILPIYNLTTSF